MKIYFATFGEDSQGIGLTNQNVSYRLWSYFFMKDLPKEFLPQYVITGIASSKKNKKK